MARSYPQGRISADDEGEVAISIAVDHLHKVVVLDFGKPIVWIGLPADQVRELAKALLARADILDPPAKST